jgi:hypothetical protein
MNDPKLDRIREIVGRAKAVHADLIKEFTDGGIFDPVQAPLLKKGIDKFESFFRDIGNSKSIDEIEKVIKKHFTSEEMK